MAVATRLGLVAILATIFSSISLGTCEDLPCRARDVGIEGRSIVCVCDANYCDTITREVPEPGSYVVYTSSNAGKRFEKSFGVIETEANAVFEDSEDSDTRPTDDSEDEFEESIWNRVVFRIFTNTRFQFIEGFGGSVTDAASINWRKLSDSAQTHLIESYFGSTGLEYNMIRVPIAGSDFSTHPYTYNEYPWHDAALSNYSLTEEDLFFKLPMIKRSQQLATDKIQITASTWSPPIWMKTNERITGFGQLRTQYYQAYADYHLRFLEEYEKAEVKIWAITTTNEPLNGIIPLAPFNSLGFTPRQLARWVANNLGPTIRNSRFNDTLILAVDDQRYILHIWMLGMEREDPRSMDYIDGIAIHYYGNFFPPAILSDLQSRYPNKILLSTEACEGPMPWHLLKVEIGSWRRARRYITSIMEDLNNYVVGWIDWNLCLDPNGGPNWANNFVDAPILVYGDQDEFIKQPMFYAMGHFSKFVPRGSRRIWVSRRSLVTVQNVAFIKPDGNIVVVLQNTHTQSLPICICPDPKRFPFFNPMYRTLNTFYIGGRITWTLTKRSSERIIRIRITAQRYIEFIMEPQSVKTIEINPN